MSTTRDLTTDCRAEPPRERTMGYGLILRRQDGRLGPLARRAQEAHHAHLEAGAPWWTTTHWDWQMGRSRQWRAFAPAPATGAAAASVLPGSRGMSSGSALSLADPITLDPGWSWGLVPHSARPPDLDSGADKRDEARSGHRQGDRLFGPPANPPRRCSYLPKMLTPRREA